MDIAKLLDFIWKPCKAGIFRILCGSDYQKYLFLKAGCIRLASRLGLYERENLAFLRSVIKPDDSVLDIGAHYGIYSGVLSGLVGETGRVMAFEPLPEVYNVLAAEMAKFKNVKCHNCAVSNGAIAELLLVVPFLSGGVPEPALASHHHEKHDIYGQYKVPCVRLDQLQIEGKVSFIKIDVESHEAEVLQGAAYLLDSNRPLVQLEISKRNFQNASAPSPFGLSSYRIARLRAGSLESLPKIDEEGIYYLVPSELNLL